MTIGAVNGPFPFRATTSAPSRVASGFQVPKDGVADSQAPEPTAGQARSTT
ncbi:MAG TPA: hypothetical protein VFE41_04185 [Acetobacteraceae bacterium]|jgi:hypothetical protein|nr:hypothetical protein [Acetobacteraceae bacterium]HTC09428.1 hypothetical protein [Acetobacteraceae bacterium]